MLELDQATLAVVAAAKVQGVLYGVVVAKFSELSLKKLV